MFENRIIPLLTIVGEDLVKTKNFRNPRYIGDPLNVIRIFNEKEVDELTLIDISENSKFSEPNYDYIASLAEECNMPLTYGGKITLMSQVDKLFMLGFEKILIRNGIELDSKLINQIASKYGSQSLVCGIDVSSDENKDFGEYNQKMNSYINNGAGEILINDISRDGTLKGSNREFMKIICENKKIPITWAGGFNSLCDIKEGFNSGISAAAVGAFFSFYGKFQSVLITYPEKLEIYK